MSDPVTVADKIYHGMYAQASFSDQMLELADAGSDWAGETFDPYDLSFEFKQCLPDVRLNKKQIEYFRWCGFDRCWLCHTDGSETYYYTDRSPENPDGIVREHRKGPRHA